MYLTIYNLFEREAASLVNQVQNKGTYEVQFNGNSLSSGVYYYKLTVNSFNGTNNFQKQSQ